MNYIPIWVLSISLFFLLQATNSVEEDAKRSLIDFLGKLSNNNNGLPDPNFGWNLTSDPCKDMWKGVTCDVRSGTVVKKLSLGSSNLSGTLDVGSLCNVQSLAASLTVLSLDNNSIGGEIPAEIANCKQLAGLHLSGNQFFGKLPDSLSMLSNMKKLDISSNNFSGNLPNFARIVGLTMFLAQFNQLSGEIPQFDFSNLEIFNVSFNNFSGSIPDVHGRFPASSFLGNPELCGDPLPNQCPPSSEDLSEDKNPKGDSKNQFLMYSGYVVLVLALAICFTLKICKSNKKEENVETVNKVASVDDSIYKPSTVASAEFKPGMSRSEISATSADSSALVSSSLVFLTSPVVNGLKFEDLLRAPAELLGRGKHGSLYKVIFENGMVLAVKRIKDWAISGEEFRQRMQRIDQVKHPNVLPALAFYTSKQEKLLVYEYQQNGSLLRLLHATQLGQAFDWASRLSIAAHIAEALAFMHQELHEDEIPHGNLKSSNILLNKNMEPCISEYGLMVADNQEHHGAFRADLYRFGVILLELLTGKLVENNGFDLAKWVHSVVREEWTVEVFDKALISEGASEERMVNLLQVAIKCVNASAEASPSINQIAGMINTIKEEEERSVTYDP